jgi:hypothetical protein
VFEKWFAGSTGDPPVSSGDSPDGTEAKVPPNGNGLFAKLLAAIPVGESPAPPLFQNRLLIAKRVVGAGDDREQHNESEATTAY